MKQGTEGRDGATMTTETQRNGKAKTVETAAAVCGVGMTEERCGGGGGGCEVVKRE